MYEAVYAHVIMELVIMNEKHLARLILDEQKELLIPNWYQDLWSIIYENRMPFTLAKMNSVDDMITLDDPTVQKSRQMLVKLVKEKMILISKPKSKESLLQLILLAKSKRNMVPTDASDPNQLLAASKLGYP